VTAVRVDGVVVPLNPAAAGRIGFLRSGPTVAAVDGSGVTLWRRSLGGEALFGGFDLDGDGTPDFAIVRTAPAAGLCQGKPIRRSWIDVYSGASGDRLLSLPPMADKCFGYPVRQWTQSGIEFGTVPRRLAVAPQYADDGSFLADDGGHLSSLSYILPSTARFDAAYPGASHVNAWGEGHGWVANTHAENGLLLRYRGQDRFVMFATARVLQYAVGPRGPAQLIADHPFLARRDLGGRNYGLVTIDPADPGRVALIAGSSTFYYWKDALRGEPGSNPWGGIERHVTIYDVGANATDQRFFSSAHDPDGADRSFYAGRIVYPAHAWLPAVSGRSHLVYNEFDDGHWQLHVSQAGSAADLLRLPDLFAWDVRDLDGDGMPEVIASPTADGPHSPVGAYLPAWKTVVLAWDPAVASLRQRSAIEGIPYLVSGFREATSQAIDGWLYPVLTGRENGRFGIFTIDADGAIGLAQLGE
jgi:hypothetical protein